MKHNFLPLCCWDPLDYGIMTYTRKVEPDMYVVNYKDSVQ